ncbi:uncharacterized protein LOC135205986 [Macrobrachium nipponense]|uniref:uncharacterized protein LOC135205986 n=1 Tax=Macrobrachium nipponense TaxID=159736 RepID=UPI0030C7F674
MERAPPVADSQRLMLLNLIKEHESVINDRSTGSRTLERKRQAWQEITLKFNAMYPDQPPRSSKQVKRCFDHVKRKVKQEDAAVKKKLCRTGGGSPPDLRNHSEEFVIAASLMTEELVMDKDVFETFHPVDETGEPIHDVKISITEPLPSTSHLPSTSAQSESGVSSNHESRSTFLNRSATSSPSSMEHLIFKPIVPYESSRPSTPIVTPGRTSPKLRNTSRDVSPIPRSSTHQRKHILHPKN